MHDYVRSMTFRAVAAFFLAAPLGCSAAEAPVSPSLPVPEAGVEETPAPPAVRSEACVALDERLRSALATIRKNGSFDVSLQWKSEDCPSAFVTSGVSNLDERALFRVGSITKTYMTVLTLSLAEKGKLGLDDRVDAVLVDAPSEISALTIKQLLQHTSGLFNYTETKGWKAAFSKDPRREWQPRELVDLALAEEPYAAPGKEWHYSNTGYIVLGMLLEAAGGKPLAALLREEVLVPNGLSETFLDGEEPIAGTLAPGFDTRGRAVGSGYALSWAWAAGAVVASSADVARFIELTGRQTIVPPKFRSDLTEAVATPQPGLTYGLGVFLADDSVTEAGQSIGHGGDIPGYHSWGWYLPEKKTTLAAWVNSDSADANAVVAAALTTLFSDR